MRITIRPNISLIEAGNLSWGPPTDEHGNTWWIQAVPQHMRPEQIFVNKYVKRPTSG